MPRAERSPPDRLDEPRTRERALAIVALCIGGIIAARSVDDPSLADDLRRAAHRHALSTGGWSRGSERVARISEA